MKNIVLSELLDYLKKKVFIVIFLLGVIIGTLLINVLNENYYKKINVAQEHYINIVSNVTIDNKEVFRSTFSGYCKEFIVLIIINIFVIGKMYNILYLFIKGAGVGVVLSSCVMQYGLKGMLLYFMSIFPHYILYIPAVTFTIYIATKMRKRPVSTTRLIKYFLAVAVISTLIAICETYVSIPIFRNASEWSLL